MNPAAYKAQFMFDVSKQSERLTEGVVDLTVKMEFSENVPTDTQRHFNYVIVAYPINKLALYHSKRPKK